MRQTINISIATEIKDAGQRAAKAERLSLSRLIEKLLSDHCKRNGLLNDNSTRTD